MKVLYRIGLWSCLFVLTGCALFTPPLQRAVTACNLQNNQSVQLLDEGRTVSISLGVGVGGLLGEFSQLLGVDLSAADMQNDGVSQLSASNLQCLFDSIEMPAYVRMAIAKASALDGRQTESFGNYTVSWSADVLGTLDVLIVQR